MLQGDWRLLRQGLMIRLGAPLKSVTLSWILAPNKLKAKERDHMNRLIKAAVIIESFPLE